MPALCRYLTGMERAFSFLEYDGTDSGSGFSETSFHFQLFATIRVLRELDLTRDFLAG
jgi:hypothetical protein